MLIWLVGNDSYLIKEKVLAYEEKFRTKFDPTGLNLDRFAITDQVSANLALSAALSLPFLSERRLIFVTPWFSQFTKKADLEFMMDRIKSIPPETIFVMVDQTDAVDLDRHPFNTLIKLATTPSSSTTSPSTTSPSPIEAHLIPCNSFSGNALTQFVESKARALQLAWSTALTTELIARTGNDTWTIATELQRLAGFFLNTTPTVEILRTLVPARSDSAIFTFLDNLGSPNPATVMTRLAQERSAGTAEGQIWLMLVRQIRLSFQSSTISEELGQAKSVAPTLQLTAKLHPFVAQKIAISAAKRSLSDWRTLLNLVVDLDSQIKLGLPLETATDRLLIALTGIGGQMDNR